jgi:hypothetical protein
MTVARLGPNQLARAQEQARTIAVTIVNRQARTPERKSDQARVGSII